MNLDRLSASAMIVAELCMSRFVANQKAERNSDQPNRAAQIGSVCHKAFELYVTQCILQVIYAPGWNTLRIFVMQAYCEEFDENIDSEEFKECESICKKWLARNSFEGFKILSCEVKRSFPVRSLSTGIEVPFNYIMDRFDELEEGKSYRVVDYKSFQVPVSPDELHDKIQAQVYALATWLEYPYAESVWVAFDLLRHDKIVQSKFTKDEARKTWAHIKRVCEKIIATDPATAKETVNEQCGWCIKRTTCKALQGNAKAGGIFSYEDLDTMIDQRKFLKFQVDGAKKALDDIDTQIKALLENQNLTRLDTATTVLNISRRPYRSVDAQTVVDTVGTELFTHYTQPSMSLKDLELLLEDPRLTPEQKLQLEQAVHTSYSKPSLTTKEKK